MYALPDVDEVVAVAKELGIHLGPDEASMYRKHLMEQMDQLDSFVQARLEESKPPMVSSARKPGLLTIECRQDQTNRPFFRELFQIGFYLLEIAGMESVQRRNYTGLI